MENLKFREGKLLLQDQTVGSELDQIDLEQVSAGSASAKKRSRAFPQVEVGESSYPI